MMRITTVFAGVFLLAACSAIEGGTACTTNIVYGISVQVLDSATRAPVGSKAMVVATDGSYSDTAKVFASPGTEPEFLALVPERAGTYTVTVSRSSYRTWVRTGVRVGRDECHVRVVKLVALLQQLL